MEKTKSRFRDLSEKILIFVLGIIFFGGVFAAWNDIKTNTDILTAQDWNDLVANIGGGGSWTVSGDDVYRETGNVGIGSAAPVHKLDVVGTVRASMLAASYENATMNNPSFGVNNNSNQWVYGIFSKLGYGSYNGITRENDIGLFFSEGAVNSDKNLVIAPWSTSTSGIKIMANGNVGIANAAPTERLDVVGNIKASGDVCNGDGECIGGGGTVSQKRCVISYATPSFVAVANSHRSIVLVPNAWTGEDCWQMSLALIGGAPDYRYQLMCIFEDGTFSIGGYSNTNNNPVPSPNCGW